MFNLYHNICCSWPVKSSTGGGGAIGIVGREIEFFKTALSGPKDSSTPSLWCLVTGPPLTVVGGCIEPPSIGLAFIGTDPL